jgi:AcrR family transcriptional regulator
MMEKPTSKRKEREKEARRESILDAAGRVMSRKGYYQATLEEIAEEAELAKGTLYLYYKDKEDLFHSLIERGYQDFLRILPGLIEKRGSLEEFINGFFSLSLKYMIDHHYLFRVIFSAEHQMSHDSWEKKVFTLTELLKRMVEILKKVFSEMPETSKLNDEDKETGAEIVLASLRFLFVTRAMKTGEAIPQQDIKRFARFLSRGLITEITA